MGKPTGFVEWPRRTPDRRDRQERTRDWQEIYLPQADEQARQQAGRCMDCGVPFCQNGCPLGNLIPEWNDLAYRGRWRAAYERLDATNNFPEFTGRLCPAPCEGSCVLAIDTAAAPVTIEHIEKEIIERAFGEGWVAAHPRAAASGRHVAVVGSGPAGLAAAQQLARAGHKVTVYEADEAPGGMLRFGIPDFKMEKHVIDRRLALMEAEGVEFRCGVAVGRDVTWSALRSQHDALLLAVGARRARDLEVPGREPRGIHFAMDYLCQQNRVVAGAEVPAGERIDAAGKRVVILGGGDTGSDCYGTALRQGAASVLQIELLPAPPPSRAVDNPWPTWPLVFRTSSSHEEGGERDFALMTRRVLGEDGRVTALEAARVDLVAGPDGRKTLAPRAGEPTVIPADLVLLAMGFTGPEVGGMAAELELALDARGNIAAGADYATSAPGVYAAGDARRGQSLIVWAIAEGRQAARAIDRHLAAADGKMAPWSDASAAQPR
ncbi:MAG TPA: glutamate synthase subunit beta [Kofleriaceae bacterium]|nr:glutamate synthase subunit beta [Kofleriaceae bacterium]